MKKNLIVLSLAIMLAIGCLTANAEEIPVYQYYSISITPVVQAKSNWCWAACAEMAGKKLYPSSTRTQYDAAYSVLGSYDNSTADISGSASATMHVAYNYISVFGIFNTLSFNSIHSIIHNGYPVQAAAGYYSGGWRTGGHVVVIKGSYYNVSNNTEHTIEYVDPANGNTYTCSYAAFCNGTYNGRIYDQTAYTN